jgi:nitrogen regulatory protein P-II 1
MLKVEAIVRPFALDNIKRALAEIGIDGMTMSDVSGFGRQKGHTEHYRGAEYVVAFNPKIKIEMVVSDDDLEKVTRVLREAAASGASIGQGKIFVYPATDAIRIRTGERGLSALS